mgnify:CR=1 FL=1
MPSAWWKTPSRSRPGVDLPGLLAQIQAAFGKECLPLNLPAAKATKVSDCFFTPAGEADFSSVAEAHQRLVDQVVEVDEELMATYREKGEVSPEELHEPLERAAHNARPQTQPRRNLIGPKRAVRAGKAGNEVAQRVGNGFEEGRW